MQPDRMSELREIVAKSSEGVVTLAKMLVDSPSYGGKVTEAEFTALCTEQARKAFPSDKPDVAFSKYFAAPENAVIRSAHRIVATTDQFSYMKGEALEAMAMVSLQPVYTGGEGDFSASAYDQLVALTHEQMKRENLGAKEFARVFAQTYSDPRNAQLAEMERRQNRPGAAARAAQG